MNTWAVAGSFMGCYLIIGILILIRGFRKKDDS